MGSKEEVAKLNPLVMPSGAIKRVHVTESNRGGTPPVFIQNPETPYFDPYNHEFPTTNASTHNQFGTQFTGGWTALHAAAQAKFAGVHENMRPVHGDLDEARFLLDGLGHHVPPSISLPHYSSPSVDVNATTTKTGLSPLHVAVRAEHKEMVQLLLERNARVDIKDGMGRTPIHYACEKGFISCLEPMIAVGGGNKAGFLTVSVLQAFDLPELCEVDEISFFTTVRVERELRNVEDDKSSPVKQRTLNPEWKFQAVFQDCTPKTKFTVEVHCRFVDGQETPAGWWSGAIEDFLDGAAEGPGGVEPPDAVPKEQAASSSDAGEEDGEAKRTETQEHTQDVGSSVMVELSRWDVPTPPEDDELLEEEEVEEEEEGVGAAQLQVQYTPVVDLCDTMGTTALMLAADGGHMECAVLLLAAGAKVSLRCEFGTTASSRAGTAGHAEVCRLIEGHGGVW